MAAPRLSDAQKQELVSRFRDGAGTQELAAAYGCSPNTIIRVVKAAIEPSLYEELKRQRGRRGGQASELDPVAAEPPAAASEQPSEPAAIGDSAVDPPPARTFAGSRRAATAASPQPEEVASGGDAAEEGDAAETPGHLAIDDADDFDGFEDEEQDDDDDEGASDYPTFVEVPISLGESLDQPLTTARPWCAEELPASAYMLVDKTVELQARPLGEIPELGRLEAEDLELQALVLYSNPRQAKRHCGRSQRVIKVPDVGVLERTAAYLQRQGICRVVLEGALYALPDT